MYEKNFITAAVQRSTSSEVDRRKLFTMLGVGGAAAAAATVVGGTAANAAPADAASDAQDAAVLNFALNLEYLEAEFYLRAVTGLGLTMADAADADGKAGAVYGGKEVKFKTKSIAKYAREIARDEREHVRFLRGALGKSAVARPKIALDAAFSVHHCSFLLSRSPPFDRLRARSRVPGEARHHVPWPFDRLRARGVRPG